MTITLFDRDLSELGIPDVHLRVFLEAAGATASAGSSVAVLADLALADPEFKHAPDRIRLDVEMQRRILEADLAARFDVGF